MSLKRKCHDIIIVNVAAYAFDLADIVGVAATTAVDDDEF